ncbi:hypothetical protein [Mycobacteroides abscessus]|uniref:hypothetical protein n=1 Tax=Mycobacteroides abscessus TaxID=36809 RepID=UPI0009A68142|nr:hypothetical protein [Mycobacteroides abscessus]MDM3948242.1 hypothetical protein [Mycobacteroides abscessus]SLI77137.1 Uncharacterised protein [Mycobacteroides abscessus subsp. massiliense]
MNLKKLGVAVATAAMVSLPLAACGSSTAPVVTTVTATPSLAPCPPVNDPGWERCFDDHRAQRERDAAAKQQQQSSAPAKSTSSGLPWWSWLLIVPGGLVALLVLGFKALEWNDDRTIARANDRVDELDARVAARASRVHDYPDDFEDDEDDELDELPEEDMDFLDKVTDPAPAPSAPPAGGGLLSSLRQQNQ